MESITTVDGSTMPGMKLDEDTFLFELDFAELLLDGFFAVVEDDDLTMLDDDSSKDGSTELLSSPQAAKKSAIETEAQKTSLFILHNIKKIPARMSQDKGDPGASARSATLSRGDKVMETVEATVKQITS